MPIPFLIGFAAWELAAMAAAAAAAAYGAKKAYDYMWPEEDAGPILKKKIAVVGGLTIGKTRLINFLKNGEYTKPNATVRPDNGDAKFLMEKLDIDAYSVTDVPGEGYDHWKSALEDADIVIYITKAKEILYGDEKLEVRINKELKEISNCVSENKKCVFGVFVSWCDELVLEGYSETDNFYASIESKIKSDLIYRNIRTYFSCKNFLISGSLVNKESTNRVFSRLIEELKNAQ